MHFVTNSNKGWLINSTTPPQHVTPQFEQRLFLLQPNGIVIENRSCLWRKHTRSMSIDTPIYSGSLFNVLWLPSTNTNLIYVSHFCKKNNALLNFLDYFWQSTIHRSCSKVQQVWHLQMTSGTKTSLDMRSCPHLSIKIPLILYLPLNSWKILLCYILC